MLPSRHLFSVEAKHVSPIEEVWQRAFEWFAGSTFPHEGVAVFELCELPNHVAFTVPVGSYTKQIVFPGKA